MIADTHVWETDSGRTLLDRERPTATGKQHVASFEAAGEPVRDVETGHDVGSIVERIEMLERVAVSRDHRRAESVSLTDFPGGPAIPTTALPGEINLTTAPGRSPVRLAGHTEWVSALVFDPAGQRLVSSSLDGTVRVWDAAPELAPRDRSLTGLPATEIQPDRLRTHRTWVATSPDGRLVAGWAAGAASILGC